MFVKPGCCFLILIQLSAINPTLARLSTYADASAELEFYNRQIFIEEDGKSTEIIEKQVKVLNENGRSIFGTERLFFNENMEKIEILEAKTVFEGNTYPVSKDMIEIKPLASDIKGFDQMFQIFISYTHVSPGSQLYLKYKLTTLKQPLTHYFAPQLYWGEEAWWRNSDIQIQSKLPLHLMINDPQQNLEVQDTTEGKVQTITIHLKKPVYNVLTNEPPNSQLPASQKTWVNVSTFNRFEDLSRKMAKDYETVIGQNLPLLQETIKKAAQTIENSIDQINKVTSLLSERVRYMGDWRTINGRFAPRSLKDVAETGVGDCKDFSASTAAILNALGYKAQVAVIMRGMAYLPPEKTLPSLNDFNHAIVKVTSKEGKVYWIDPTNFTSMADGIYPDITNRPVLVLDSQNPSYEVTPNINYDHSKSIGEKTIELMEGDVVHTKGTIEFVGETAESITGAALTNSLETIKETIISRLSGEISPIKSKVTFPDLTSRIVRNIKIDFSFDQENILLLTNLGAGILLKTDWAMPFLTTSDEQEGTVFFSTPNTFTRKITILNSQVNDYKTLAYAIKTPWLEAWRTVHQKGQNLEIQEEVKLVKSFLTAAEIKSSEYKAFKKIIKKYANQTVIIVSQKNSNAPLVNSQPDMLGWIKSKISSLRGNS